MAMRRQDAIVRAPASAWSISWYRLIGMEMEMAARTCPDRETIGEAMAAMWVRHSAELMA